MTFALPTLLTIGLPLVAVPLIIHLINLRRHRRVRWAAMDFLLQSHKRRRKSVILKQLLLLLTRMALFALVAFMLARPVLESGLGAVFGGAESHHIVLLDDSYSMADRLPDRRSVFDEAKDVIGRLAEQAATGGDHFVTVIRFSEAQHLSVGVEPDVFRQQVDADMRQRLESKLASLGTSQTDAGPADALRAAARLPEATTAETRHVYLVSDFRARNWQRPAEIRETLARLREENFDLHLVHCTQSERANMAIDSIGPLDGVRGAGTEMWMEVSVTNHSDEPANDVTVQILQDGQNRGAIELETVPPRETTQGRFRATFPDVGSHVVAASLAPDAVDVDNQRQTALNVPVGFPILIVDGTKSQRDGYYLSSALSPGGDVRTSWQPRVEPVSFLRDTERLDEFAAIFLLDVPRLDTAEVQALEDYIERGGGVGVFVGENTNSAFVNERLYREGEGFFPAPLGLPTQLLHEEDQRVADIHVNPHPIFRAFADRRNSYLNTILVEYFYSVQRDWNVQQASSTQVLATVRGEAPLVIEKKFGDGRVVVFLTKLSAEQTSLGRWVNWLNNPMFPVMVLETVVHLSSPLRMAEDHAVGQPLTIAVSEADFLPEFAITFPLDGQEATASLTAKAQQGQLVAELDSTETSGVYSVQLTSREGNPSLRQFAVNVPTGEGDLRTLTRQQLEDALVDIAHKFYWAENFAKLRTELAGFQLSDTALYLLIGLLLFEMLLAYSASYHPSNNASITQRPSAKGVTA